MIDGFNARDLFAALTPRRRDAGGAGAATAGGREPQAAGARNPRASFDTVTLSETGGKIVNLNRAQELGAELRAEKDPDAFRDKLRLAMEDIRRIGRLFGEVVRTLFHGPRRPLG